ncbi:uncharacterized protein EV420DRAFT_96695 [Desarmillaria tabescens]|uniref:Heterokaryon incompatibility domain-containing protein n=1 Tax=Armillaria tabescens TaxID=1929756 RepID=A0AA39NRK0_ARMTA|nr:uncharacterized protein EV420DRAFT_96695 [Desarmillaria tabescens]KAK0470213.1 hypothetical protein EV420DRAFT_96695 [Desarmillaria tabescens]
MDDLGGILSPEELLFNTVHCWEDVRRQGPEMMRPPRKFREVTLHADTENDQPDAVSSIHVPMQRVYTCTTYPVLTTYYANQPCTDFTAATLLNELNSFLGTSERRSRTRHSFLDTYISRSYDFGTTLGHLRSLWYDDINTLANTLRIREAEDHAMRQKALANSRIINPKTPPRRVWDLYSNRVVPYWVIRSTMRSKLWAISHAWMDEHDRSNVMTPINGREWPVPMPKGSSLNLIRIEMLGKGAEYVWLDVLCLRQKGGKREDLREEEWKLDVPTIGHVYRMATKVVYYFSGLGLPFRFEIDSLQSKRCWFNRAWTLQEIGRNRIVGGLTDGTPSRSAMQTSREDHHAGDRLRTFYQKLGCFENLSSTTHNVVHALALMQDRVSQNPVDKIAGLAFLLESNTIPAYYETQSVEDAWTALVNTMQKRYRAQLLFLYPNPGDGDTRWRPSWKQVMAEVPSFEEDPCVYGDLRWDEKMNVDTFKGYCIWSGGYVRGLAVGNPEGGLRHGELLVRDWRRKLHTFQIVATHQHPIPDGPYSLLSNNGLGVLYSDKHWVAGKMRPGKVGPKFEKVSVFELPDEEELLRLIALGLAERGRISLM